MHTLQSINIYIKVSRGTVSSTAIIYFAQYFLKAYKLLANNLIFILCSGCFLTVGYRVECYSIIDVGQEFVGLLLFLLLVS